MVVPRPTLTTPMYSSSILKISVGFMEEIPDRENNVVSSVIPAPTLPDKVWVIFVAAIGDWTKSSMVMRVFVFLSLIVNWCAFPSPREVNVTAVPDLVVDIWNVSTVLFTTNTLDGNSSVVVYFIALAPTPTKVEFGV